MRIVITGASGFVGRQLVPILHRGGAELLLAGRDPGALARTFPSHRVCGYDDLDTEARGFDTLLHLAVLNNDVEAPAAAFTAVNVDFLLEVLGKARQAGIGTFVNVSSTHALAPDRSDPYSASKRAAVERLRGEAAAGSGTRIVTLYMPLLYGDRWAGRLAPLNKLPRPLARFLFLGLAALKPTAHVGHLAEFVLRSRAAELPQEMILADGQADNVLFGIAKRTTDLVFAAIVLVPFCWLLLAILVAVRAQTHGPAIFAQSRVGRGGARFTCFKFRTMAVGTAEAGTHEVSEAAITPIGRFLRRTKLDELPQAINILRNEVSLVGPRPCLPVQTELVEARRRRGVFDIKPGLTGLAQVNGVDMRDPDELAVWDSHYLAMQSLLLDARIVLRTLRRGHREVAEPVVPGRTGIPLAPPAPAAE